jgi:hypothetical protein
VTIKPGAYPWGNHDNAWRPPTSTSPSSGGLQPPASSPRCTSPATRSSSTIPSSSPCATPKPAAA